MILKTYCSATGTHIMSFLTVVMLIASGVGIHASQELIDDLANNLGVDYAVLDNLNPVGDLGNQWTGEIGLTYNGETAVTSNEWEIYFCSVRLFQYDTLSIGPDQSIELGSSGIEVSHVDGCLHRLKPMADFSGFIPSERILLPFSASDWSVSRTDAMPKWYVKSTGEDIESRIIASTAAEALDFVTDFTTANQWKRRSGDLYDPYTPEQRFDLTGVVDDGRPVKHIIPTPVEYSETAERIQVDTGDWVVVYADDNVLKEAQYLAEKMGTIAIPSSESPSSRYISLAASDGSVFNTTSSEAYTLVVTEDPEKVDIQANSATGAFYGAQSLLSLMFLDGTIPVCSIRDFPRFPYRGMHIDVGRNFHSKEEILKLLEVMAMFKLNKFYFHLTEDEGWRLEIPGIPELTTIGARRCDDLTEMTCILSQLGSGPFPTTSGTGFYTVEDYKEILQYATDRHIEVIPEFDMPGHGHAAIRAMEARDATGATPSYLLSDAEDNSQYLSVQYFRYNAINPCLPTTYAFVEKIIDEVMVMHQDIQPLAYFNFGGDETAYGAWEDSPACATYVTEEGLEFTRDALKIHFTEKIADIAHTKGLKLAGWEDGLMEGLEPYDRSIFDNEEVLGFAWNNIWEWGSGQRAYILANNGYQVVLSHATHLYFDHPQEPDPEERGFYWATRTTDAKKTFGYMPDDVYKNIDVSNFGESLDGYCDTNPCEPLEEENRENVLGMQGHLWSETVRSSTQLNEMIYPRILALAERAWHKAEWESLDDFEDLRQLDWEAYANTVGYKELSRLDQLDVLYHIPPPGARITEDSLYIEANTMYPGLHIQYSTDQGANWFDYSEPVLIDSEQYIFATRSADRRRISREIVLETEIKYVDPNDAASTLALEWTLLVMCYFIKLVFHIE